MTLTDRTGAIAAAIPEGETVSVSESSTGGLIAASLLAVPGASRYFLGGSVVYTLQSRKVLLELTREDVEGLEPMTEEIALAFARKTRDRLDSTWGIAELGIAGPTGAPYGHPPGSSVIAVAGPIERAQYVSTGSDDREANMWAFTDRALALFQECLTEHTG